MTDDSLQAGLAAFQAGRYEESLAPLARAAELRPGDALYLHLLGLALHALGREGEAAVRLGEALALAPDDSDIYNNLGSVLLAQGRAPEAAECFGRAVALRPDYTVAWVNRGLALSKADDGKGAEAAFRRGLLLDPGQPTAWNGLGVIHYYRGEGDSAETCFRRALEFDPRHVPALVNLGNLLSEARDLEGAEVCYRDVLDIDPACADAHFRLAQVLLLRGQWGPGFAEYEWRWQTSEARSWHPDLAVPRWRGEELAGRTILLWAEQGLGDALQFVRYAPLVARRGGRVILHCPQPLVRLFSGVEGVAEAMAELPAGGFDLHCPLMSLPLVFGTTPDTVPSTAYLRADPGDALRWRRRLEALSGRRVGLVWAGNPRKGFRDAALIDARRSIPACMLAPLAEVEGVAWLSLQKGAHDRPNLPLSDWTEALGDFDATAALVEGLDLVLTVDTSVAHLAGGLGIPVWLLSRFDGCWRWLQDRQDSPWYPSMRIFRQEQPGQWRPVVAEVAQALRGRL